MLEKEVIVKSVTGLHARPGSDLVQLALNYKANINLVKADGSTINAKEIFEVLSAGINCGDKIVVRVDGEDAQVALDTIANFIETRED